MKRILWSLAIVVTLFLSSPVQARKISLLVIESDSVVASRAVKGLRAQYGLDARFFTHSELQSSSEARAFVKDSSVIIVDVMMKDLSNYVIKEVDLKKVKVYALRGSRDDEGLKKRGFIFDPEVQAYFKHLNEKNVRNLILKVAYNELDKTIKYEPPQHTPILGIYHSRAKRPFDSYGNYIKWYEAQGHLKPKAPWIGIAFFSASLAEGQRDAVDYVIKRLEKEGFNLLPCFGKDIELVRSFFLDERARPRVDIILAFSFKFYSSLNKKLRDKLEGLDVPIINAINLYSIDIPQWRKDPLGIPPTDVVWTIANPEISGLIEPTPLTGRLKVKDQSSGKLLYLIKPIPETLDHLIPRIHKWLALRRKGNNSKRVAILFYNHSQGKQNIGASYLNVFNSIQMILERMRQERYHVGRFKGLDQDKIKELILNNARNIGSWAPGELEKMAAREHTILVPIDTYKAWFSQLPQDFKSHVVKQWGRPEDSSIMVYNKKFVIPALISGNVVLLPEPARGWGDDAFKLYHDPTLYPHHQYIAVYLWLEKVFGADAMIHLGTHATHEWLPGKQAGLGLSCPPEVLITDIPNIYPYIVDDVGEGIQAKRRGRSVIIDHLTPALMRAELYGKYSRLYEMINDYHRAVALGSKTTAELLNQINRVIQETGILRDLDIAKLDKEGLQEVEHYLLQIKHQFMPYGLHTFGLSPRDEALDETVKAIIDNNPGAEALWVRMALRNSGPRELESLMRALEGKYIPSGEGNDPLRNPSAIPTGKNFYGFSPDKIPSLAVWSLGKRAAAQIIEKKLKETGNYPQKVAVVLWATETIRNQGINESTILFLMGLKPVWDINGRVTGTRVIPGRELGRPRIDVLINPSGLYRDLFPNMITFLDKAVQKAAAQKDIENLIAKNSKLLKQKLMGEGLPEERAELLSKLRIFTEKPGSYGTGVSEMTSQSGIWSTEDEIVEAYENRTGYGFGLGMRGENARGVLKKNLGQVDVAVHSLSSNVYGTMDNDDMFQYLGGLNLAVKREAGRAPDTVVTIQRMPDSVEVEGISKTVGRELRVRYLNPKWIQAMIKEEYAGAREMAKFVEYMWGWQVTTPQAVDEAKWNQVYKVYVEDEHKLDLKEFFDQENPWAYQSITARMLEAVRKDYWRPGEKIKAKLAVEYALNVVQKGVACCDHTCNNPLLNQMVLDIISLPGAVSPRVVEKFKLAIEQAAKKTLNEQVKERKAAQKELADGPGKSRADTTSERSKGTNSRPKSTEEGPAKKYVKGFKMEEVRRDNTETDMSSSGIQWLGALFVALIIAVVALGIKRHK